jgi:predicted Fe-Mo cluster-binding NifX family protein
MRLSKMETCIFIMTVTKRKITEIESIVNQADKRKTAGKIYLPKDWIGKRVKTILLSKVGGRD